MSLDVRLRHSRVDRNTGRSKSRRRTGRTQCSDPRRRRVARTAEDSDGRGDPGRLVPLFIGSGAGSEVMQRIAVPMIGGKVTVPLFSMLIIPAAYRLLCRRRIARSRSTPTTP